MTRLPVRWRWESLLLDAVIVTGLGVSLYPIIESLL